MDDALIDIATDDDPEAAAAAHNVPFRAGAVRVEILLADADADTPTEIRSVTTRRRDLIDAWVPVGELYSVAARDAVRWVQRLRELEQHTDTT